MTLSSGGLIDVLLILLPGFVALGVFRSLTSHPRPSDFGLVAQALIFAAFARAISELILSGAPRIASWSENAVDASILIPVAVAVGLGLLTAYLFNHDIMHSVLRRARVTKENAYPSEWYSAFYRHSRCYVVLHLQGERRLYGWPEEWPGQPERGHFRIAEAEWLVDDKRIVVDGVTATLIPAREVEMVEFLTIEDAGQSEE